MLSKNNYQEKLRHQEQRKQRFAIKKLTVGVASVLIGFTFMGVNAANADSTVTSDKVAVNANDGNKQSDAQSMSVLSQGPSIKSAVVPKTGEVNSENVTATNQKKAQSSGDLQDADTNNTNQLTVQTAASSQTSSSTANVLEANKVQTRAATNNLDSNYTVNADGVADISTYGQFSKAFVDKNVKTMNLTADIDFTGLKHSGGAIYGSDDSAIKGGLYTGGTKGNHDNTGLGAYELGTAEGGVWGGDNYKDAPRDLTIKGNNHTLNMGKWFISLWDKGYNTKWDLTLKDLTINSDGASHSPFYVYQYKTKVGGAKGTSITYDGVTANINGQGLIDYGKAAGVGTQMPVNVTLAGKSNLNINMQTGQNAIKAFNLDVKDGADITFNVTDPLQPGLLSSYDTFTTSGDNDNAIYLGTGSEDGTLEKPASQGNFTMGKNSKLVFNKGIDRTKEGHNLRFLYDQNYHGNVILEQGATLDLTMGSGHSTAIETGNLQIEKGATVNIDTWQNNNKFSTTTQALFPGNDYYHIGPITLGMPTGTGGIAKLPSSSGSYTVNVDGTLRIIRNTPELSGVSPLISYGNQYPNSGSKFYFNVGKGATLDLQDALSTAYANHNFLHTDLGGYEWINSDVDNVNIAGLITMFGTSSENHIVFDNPEYINLQRTGNQIGTMFRTEGVTNDVTVKGDAPITIAQWDIKSGKSDTGATPTGAWQISNMYNQMNGGNYSANFLPVGQKQGINHKFGYNMASSNSTVTMAPSMGNYTYTNGYYFYNDPVTHKSTQLTPNELKSPGLLTFTNDFNWWSPRRISLVTGKQEQIETQDADKYQPITQEIRTTVGKKLANLSLQDGIRDLEAADGSVYQDHATILSADSDIDWTKSHWGFDWAQTPWKNGGTTTPTFEDGDPAANEYVAYKGMANSVLKTDKDGNLVSTDGKSVQQVATLVYKDGSVDFVFVPVKVNKLLEDISTGNLWFWKGSNTLSQLINKLKSTPDGVPYNKLSIYFRNLFTNPVAPEGSEILYSLADGVTASDFDTNQVGFVKAADTKPLLHVVVKDTATGQTRDQADLSFGFLILEQPKFNGYEVPLNYGFNSNDDIKNILANYKDAVGYPIGINWIHQPDTSKPGHLTLQEQVIYNTGNPANGFGKFRLPGKQTVTIHSINVSDQTDFTPMVIKGTNGSVEAELTSAGNLKMVLLSRQNGNEQFVTNQAGLLVNQAGTAFVSAQPATTLTVKKATKTLDTTQLKALLNTSLLQTTGLPYQLNGDALKLTDQTVEGKVKVQIGNQDNYFDLYVPVQASLKVVPDTSESVTVNETPDSSSTVASAQPVTSALPDSSSEVTKPEQPTVPTSTAAPVQSAATSAEQPSQAPVSSAVTSGIINEPSASSSAVAPAQPVTSAQPTSSAVVASDVPASQAPASSSSARPNSSEVAKPEQPTVPTSTAAPVQSAATSTEQSSKTPVSSAVTSGIINEPSASSSAVAPAQPVTSAQPTSSAVVASDVPAISSSASQAPASSTSALPDSSSEVTKPEQPTVPTSTAAPVQSAATSAEQPSQAPVSSAVPTTSATTPAQSSAVTSGIINEPSASSSVVAPAQPVTSAQPTSSAVVASDVPATSSPASQAPVSSASATVPVQSITDEAKSAVTVTKVVSNSNTRLTTSSVASHSQVINPLQINANLGQIANHAVKASPLQPQSKSKQGLAKTNQTLPQTGDDNSKAVLGLGLGSLIAMFGLANVKRQIK